MPSKQKSSGWLRCIKPREIENGSDPDLRQFARETLPKIEDHLQRALKLAGPAGGKSTD
jgi:putative membrane protein